MINSRYGYNNNDYNIHMYEKKKKKKKNWLQHQFLSKWVSQIESLLT